MVLHHELLWGWGCRGENPCLHKYRHLAELCMSLIRFCFYTPANKVWMWYIEVSSWLIGECQKGLWCALVHWFQILVALKLTKHIVSAADAIEILVWFSALSQELCALGHAFVCCRVFNASVIVLVNGLIQVLLHAIIITKYIPQVARCFSIVWTFPYIISFCDNWPYSQSYK